MYPPPRPKHNAYRMKYYYVIITTRTHPRSHTRVSEQLSPKRKYLPVRLTLSQPATPQHKSTLNISPLISRSVQDTPVCNKADQVPLCDIRRFQKAVVEDAAFRDVSPSSDEDRKEIIPPSEIPPQVCSSCTIKTRNCLPLAMTSNCVGVAVGNVKQRN